MDNNFFRLKLSNYFITDSHEFLNRFDILKENAVNKQLSLGKLMIDLLFSLECSIKALIFIESDCEIEKIYKKIHSHKIDKLIAMLENKSQKKIKSLFEDEDFKDWSVNIRYCLEAEAYLLTTQGKNHEDENKSKNFNHGINDLMKFNSIDKINRIKSQIKEWINYVIVIYNKNEDVKRYKLLDINQKIVQVDLEKEKLKKLTNNN